MSKLNKIGWSLITIGALGTTGAVIMEYLAHEPIYLLIMKVTALCFGVGGALVGMANRQ